MKLLGQALAAGAEYSLLAAWAGLAGLAALLFFGWQTARMAVFYTLMLNPAFVLVGAGLFAAGVLLRRARCPLWLIRALGGVAAAGLAYALVRRDLYYLVVNARPSVFFFWLWYFTPVAFALGIAVLGFLFGTWRLPRHVQLEPRAHLRLLHLPILLLALVQLPVLVLPARVTSRVPPSPQIVVVKWTPGPEPLTVEAFDMHLEPPRGGLIPEPQTTGGYLNLRDDEVQRLRAAGITGRLKVWGAMGAVNSSGRAVVIMSHQLDAPFQFFGPAERTGVIYLQTPQGWRKLPPDAGDSDRPFRLTVSTRDPKVTALNGWEPALSW